MEVKECRWCGEKVDPELCFADMVEPEPIVGGEKTLWMCYCGKLVDELNASRS